MELNKIEFKGRIIKVIKQASQDSILIQGVKQENQQYYDFSNRFAGSNGTYIEFGEYHGMRLDITFSLYDTDKKYIDIYDKKYVMPKLVTLDIYHEAMTNLQMQRMSENVYSDFRKMEGEKRSLSICVNCNKIQQEEKRVAVELIFIPDICINKKLIYVTKTMYLEEVS